MKEITFFIDIKGNVREVSKETYFNEMRQAGYWIGDDKYISFYDISTGKKGYFK